MTLYIIIALVIGLLGYYLLRWLKTAKPQSVRKFWLGIGILAIIAGIALVSRYSAAIAGALVLATVVIRRLTTVLSTFIYLHRMKERISPGKHQPRASPEQPMSVKEACEILGVNEKASAKEVQKAYHHLMQKNHPDQGGSEYFAKKLNQARDTLLKKK